MSLADRIETDVERVFYRERDFARKHDWNGREITCIVDDEAALAHKNQNTLSVDWDVGEIDKVVRIPCSQFSEREMPMESEMVMLDGKMYKIEKVTGNEGEIIVLMRAQEARSVLG